MNTVELRQRRASLWEQAKSLHVLADKEKRELTAEEKQQWDKINKEIDALGETIAREERIALIDDEMAAIPEAAMRSQAPAEIREIQTGGKIEKHATNSVLPASEEYRDAFDLYLRHGLGGMPIDKRAVIQPYYGAVDVRALGVGNTAAGGALSPELFYNKLIEAMKAFGGMRQAPTTKITTTSGADMPIPMADDTDNEGAILTEGSNVNTTGTDPKFGSKPLGAYMYTSKLVRVSLQLLQDSAFNIDAWLALALGRRLGRVTNRHFTTGNGSTEPEGITLAAGEGVTDATLTDYLDLVALEHSIDPSYRANGACWMFHDTTLMKLKQMKDGEERPIWFPGLAVNAPDTILGYPYFINQAMAEAEAGEKAMLFGDFSYYFIRDVQDLRVLRLEERFAEYLQVGFLAFLRTDGVFAGPNEVTDTISDPNTNVPVKYLQLADSI
jgi:HK97 family phage major capsid protein